MVLAELVLKEQDKSSDIEQQPPFGDRKYSKSLPQMMGRGFTKPTGTYNFDKVWSGAPDGSFGKSFFIRDANNFDKIKFQTVSILSNIFAGEVTLIISKNTK